MARLKIYKDDYTETTSISNLFIDEYMKDANDAQLKIYLYLLRMLGANQPISVSDLADKFNHTEKDINRALKYWEKKDLLELEYDEDNCLTGIHLRDLSMPVPKRSAASRKQVYLSSVAPVEAPKKVIASEITGEIEAANPIDEPQFIKPAYNAEQLRAFKNNADSSQLLFIAETYIGRPLTPTEIKSLIFFKDVLNFSDDLVDYLLQYCVEREKKNFKYIEQVAINWAGEGITTPKQAQKHSSRYDKNVYAIMNELGKTGSPTKKELEYIYRWTKEYGFSTDIIFEACERTVLATDSHRFEYAEGILSSWKRENIHHKSDIKKLDDTHQKRRSASGGASSNSFNNFNQNIYDYDILEKELLSN